MTLLNPDSVTGQWMTTGMATRMAVDLGLHRVSRLGDPADRQRDPDSTDPEISRLNRLCFWSVLVTDYAVSLGVGRATSLRPESITQLHPTEEDIRLVTASVPAAFPHAAKMMGLFGVLINLLNSDDPTPADIPSWQDQVAKQRVSIMEAYRSLPPYMQWSSEK
jgi:hypothetical protein